MQLPRHLGGLLRAEAAAAYPKRETRSAEQEFSRGHPPADVMADNDSYNSRQNPTHYSKHLWTILRLSPKFVLVRRRCRANHELDVKDRRSQNAPSFCLRWRIRRDPGTSRGGGRSASGCALAVRGCGTRVADAQLKTTRHAIVPAPMYCSCPSILTDINESNLLSIVRKISTETQPIH